MPRSPEEFESILRERHATVLASRPEMNPGAFKTTVNRFGGTTFVLPADLPGTLRERFRVHQQLTSPIQRAIFMMFLVAEVHPFADGNGRMARIMMNAELAGTGHVPIIIPTVFRNDYLSALRALSFNQQTEPLIKALLFAQKYTGLIPWRHFPTAEKALEATNAFVRPEESEERGISLRLPTQVDTFDFAELSTK